MRTTLAAAALLAAAGVLAQDAEPAWVAQARSSAAELGGQLQQALQAAMREGGPVSGIEVCRLQAPAITEAVSGERIEVGRTALKIRNPGNAPDAWETRVLEQFKRRLAQGEAPERVETFAVRRDGKRRWGHWMRAIPTGPLCTACHGQSLDPEVAEALDAAYPEDRARGFAPGDLRGAFSVEVKLVD